MNTLRPGSSRTIHLRDTAFADLMQKRVFSVLLIATPYDAFMMEEDGRVEEQVYYEYVSLNLSSPPRFTMVANYEEAMEQLAVKQFDLIMAMPVSMSQRLSHRLSVSRSSIPPSRLLC